MLARSRGFTIVELLIVIVVIAILASITVAAFNGVQQRAKNTSTESSVASYRKILELYRSSYGSYAMPGSSNFGYCLGEVADYPNGCDAGAPNATFATELKKVASSLPSPDPDCLAYLSSCRRNFTLVRNTSSWTIDGQAHAYYLVYYLRGATVCNQPNSLEGSWGSFSRTQTKGYFERSQGNTACFLELPDPA